MPASCAKALRPTIALFACTGSLVSADEQLAGLEQRLGVDAGVVRQAILAHAQRHHELFERRVAGALADAVDRALDLAHAALDRRQAVGDREAEIVVAMRAEYRAMRVRHAADDLREEVAESRRASRSRPCRAG